MRIALIGYGKMGKAIEEIAKERHHQICCIINTEDELKKLLNSRAEVVIEFTEPDSAYRNIRFCIENNFRVVSGTTGWLKKYDKIVEMVEFKNTGFFYASNFSIGVNIFRQINKRLAELMKDHIEYDVHMEEIHHTQKLDAPSGTAITLAEDIIENVVRKDSWVNNTTPGKGEINIESKRVDKVPGTHTIIYNSDVDSIELKHTAHNRKGFAQGAVLAAEFMKNKIGVFGMDNLLKL